MMRACSALSRWSRVGATGRGSRRRRYTSSQAWPARLDRGNRMGPLPAPDERTRTARAANPSQAYKWIRRFKEQGLVGLEDETRRPRSSPLQTTAEMTVKILRLRQRHPELGSQEAARSSRPFVRSDDAVGEDGRPHPASGGPNAAAAVS